MKARALCFSYRVSLSSSSPPPRPRTPGCATGKAPENLTKLQQIYHQPFSARARSWRGWDEDGNLRGQLGESSRDSKGFNTLTHDKS